MTIVAATWRAMEARDWEGVRECLDEGFEAHWPQSGERFDRDGYVALNRHYPGAWSVRVVHVVESGDEVVAEVEIAIDGRVDRCVGFYRVRDGRIASARELWAEPFPVPEWRATLLGVKPSA